MRAPGHRGRRARADRVRRAPVNVKICGITRLEDAELAISLGAWAHRLHPVAASPSATWTRPWPRGSRARLRRKVELVGVFVNQPLDEIADLVDVLGLTPRAAARRRRARRSARPSPSGRARRSSRRCGSAHAADLRDLERFHTDLHLLDTASDSGAYGGTGRTWDWSLLTQRRNKIAVSCRRRPDPGERRRGDRRDPAVGRRRRSRRGVRARHQGSSQARGAVRGGGRPLARARRPRAGGAGVSAA